jgi:CheY-like chemotaxis protein
MDHAQQLRPSRQHQLVLLVVDDEAIVRNLAQITLERAGYHVLTAADGEEALTMARSFTGDIHLLLSDINMPRMDGFRLREQIVRERPGTSVMLMSGQIDPGGAVHFLHKPFTPPMLIDAVARIVRTRAAGR